MPLFLLKSVLSIFVFISVAVAVFTMFEAFGRSERRFGLSTLKAAHRANGIFFTILFFVIAYLCVKFIVTSRAELSPRGALHAALALTAFSLLLLKIIIRRFYTQFYEWLKALGIALAVVAFVMAGVSGGYYLVVTKLGTDLSMNRAIVKEGAAARTAQDNVPKGMEVSKDHGVISRGKELYQSKCYGCHDPLSNKTIVGPGHKGILKNPILPVSKKKATPENVRNQLMNPHSMMPPFSYLKGDEVEAIVAYLNTL